MKRILIIFIGLFIALIVTSCATSQSAVTSDSSNAATVDFDKQPDLSKYIVPKEPAPVKEPVPLKDNLTYVDTYYMTKLKEMAGEVSAKRKKYEQYPLEWNFVLIDSRPAPVFDAGHINGAINIPDSQFDTMTHMLPENKETELIFYCGGLACHLSGNSAEKAQKLGYSNVKVYQEGIPAWTKAGHYLTVTAPYVKNLILEANVTREDKAPFVILDARPYKKYFEAHIPNSVFADDTLFLQKFLGTAPSDKSIEIIVYCGGFSCHKSHVVAEELGIEGYSNVKVYSGGLPDWKSQGLPTFGISASEGSFNVSEGQVDRALTPEQFVGKLATGNVFVLDVRTENEVRNGAIKGSVNIPDSVIHADPAAIVSKLPSDKNAVILIHCATGARAAGVANKVADLGYQNTFYLNNAITIGADGSYSFN
ncbi:hypothetical protein EJF36_04645 [Bacillus sp. HMF5848]|uniref:rhodanese-like domain-containing protein n=1 Tax=Bacillus sp. HMF5848 TaxID=2495421 RepID=UPI000F7901EC|nr:rhodanese-like domain-containing protein [Bacillus sp. HMF5848]RSK26203.1 hypothetical protein EJF36_04645 [Bacillus sp. HMF5848]